MLNVKRLELLLDKLGKLEDRIFVDRHERKVAKRSARKRKRLDDLKGKLTAQQQYIRVHSDAAEEVDVWQAALATAEGDAIAAKLSMLHDVDGAAPGTISTSRDVSSEAEQWLERKRAREAKAAAKNTSANSTPTLPPPLFGGNVAVAGEASHRDESADPSDAERNDDDEEDEVRLWEDGWKDRYYSAKFKVDAGDAEFKRTLSREYIRGLSWVLLYYYQRVPSWSWYFPYHYAPFASDCSDLGAVDTTFPNDTSPLLPLEQLMAVFPPGSSHLLPSPLAELMLDESSPVKRFYPEDFDTDMNGFKQAWKGVAKLPFVEESELLDAVRATSSSLDPTARARNRRGFTLLHVSPSSELARFFSARRSELLTSAGSSKTRARKQRKMHVNRTDGMNRSDVGNAEGTWIEFDVESTGGMLCGKIRAPTNTPAPSGLLSITKFCICVSI